MFFCTQHQTFLRNTSNTLSGYPAALDYNTNCRKRVREELRPFMSAPEFFRVLQGLLFISEFGEDLFEDLFIVQNVISRTGQYEGGLVEFVFAVC